GILTVGSSGGSTIFVDEKIHQTSSKEGYKILVKGLLGGHSGIEINDNRGNAIKVISSFLDNIGGDFTIGEFNSGNLDNVIPSEGIVKVYGPSLDTLENAKEKTLEEFDGIKGDLEILIEE